jgi:predicted regulator of Ras-like GTPase activity (Roadblock/LC7/MglB family)
MLAPMDAAQAIADLTEISPQVREVVVLGGDGSLAGTNAEPGRADVLADGARRLLAAADEVRAGHGAGAVAQVEAATGEGSVFVVRDGDRVIAATTSPDPTVGLVFYDLKTCLRSIDEPRPKPRRRPRKQAEPAEDDAAA